MSSPATMVRIRDGKVEYLHYGDTYAVISSVIEGPKAIGNYMDDVVNWAREHGLDYPRTAIHGAEGDGCLLVDYDNKVVVFFGGDIECSCQQQQALMEEIVSAPYWEGWDVRWAYKGLLDAARYLGQESELLNSPFVIRIDEEGCRLLENMVTDDTHRASSIIAVKADGKLNLYPLDTMFPEYLLYYGESNLVAKLESQGHYSSLRLDDFDFVRGFFFDEDAMTVVFWGLCCELVPEHLEEVWQGWKAIDFEGNREEFDRLVSFYIAPGKVEEAAEMGI